MRITLTLDDEIAARLQAEARKRGRPFPVWVNECLRAGLAERPSAASDVPFWVEPFRLGAPLPGRDAPIGRVRGQTIPRSTIP